ncbi:hypothetical protein C0J52_21370 [Blattella germanica]|nr:hypothetical protein C0J52_21370 [Blattella germanica]
MSTPEGDGNNPSPSIPGGSQKLNTMVLTQKNVSTLRTGQGFNVFILSPSQLKDLGLVAKMKNGKPVIVHDNVEGSTPSRPILPKALEATPQPSPSAQADKAVVGISLKTKSLKVAFENAKKVKSSDNIELSKPMRLEQPIASGADQAAATVSVDSSPESVEL